MSEFEEANLELKSSFTLSVEGQDINELSIAGDDEGVFQLFTKEFNLSQDSNQFTGDSECKIEDLVVNPDKRFSEEHNVLLDDVEDRGVNGIEGTNEILGEEAASIDESSSKTDQSEVNKKTRESSSNNEASQIKVPYTIVKLKNVEDLQISSNSVDSNKEELSPTQKNGKPGYKRSHSNGILQWEDSQLQGDTLHRLDIFRKSKQFCDLVILVGGREIYCHRVLVGGASSVIFDELSQGEQETGPLAWIPLDAALPGLSPVAVEILIDYMYTSKLSISSSQLLAVYKASLQLGVERVTLLCRKRIIADMDLEQCIQIRRLSQNNGDNELKQYVDKFIEENFESVSSCLELLALPRIQVEVTVSPNPSLVHLLWMNTRDDTLCTTALSWIYDVIQRKGGKYIEELTEQIQRVPLEDLNNARSSNGNGYSWRQEDNRAREGRMHSISRLSRSSSMDSLTSTDSSGSCGRNACNPHGEWKVIASTQTSLVEHTISLCCLGDVLCTLIIRLPNIAAITNNLDHSGFSNVLTSSTSSTSTSCSSSVGSGSHITPLCQARCAAGVVEVNGKILVVGGYNQSECLDTVESFDLAANRWNLMARMGEKRARLAVGVFRGRIYAVGGSSGSHNQMSVECYDPDKDSWVRVQSLLMSCSEAGVGVVNDRLYCVGGVHSGVVSITTCQVYDPEKDQWAYAPPMHTGRSSFGVAALGGMLYAVGGSDGWTCLATVERFDPSANEWTFTAALNIQRRGLGLTEHNGALYCAGGFDGHSFLYSVERYCPSEGDVWTLTPTSLTIPRNNLGLVSLDNSIFAVGGFSGRHFLSSIEILNESSNEWFNHEGSASSPGETNESN